MLLIPAIDLLGGKVVRLYKGDMETPTIYSDNPADTARKFADMGVSRLHIVDLDGAKGGKETNFGIIEEIARLGILELEVGGGIRDARRAGSYFSAGVTYAILGTIAAKNIDTTKDILRKYKGKIILGIDARGGSVAVDGWYKDSGINAAELINEYKDFSAESVIYTDINKDGTLEGLNFNELTAIADKSPFPIIASGGVASSKDIETLKELAHPNIKGAIIGKAFYEGRIDLKRLLS